MSGWFFPLLIFLVLLMAWRVIVVGQRYHRTDYGNRWLNWLEGFNRLFCLRYHRLEHDPLELPDTGPALVVANHLSGLDALLLEFNHDLRMLHNGPYPPSLQRRVGGSHGHLNNAQSAGLIGQLDHHNWKHLVAAHISEKNNDPQLVRNALGEVDAALDGRFAVLDQHSPSDWFELS